MVLIDRPRAEVPAAAARVLDGGGRFFARDPDLGSRGLLWGLLLIPVLVFVLHCWVTVRAGKRIEKDDWVPAVLVLGPLGCWGTMRLLREWRRKKRSAAGMNPLGAYLGDDVLVWQVAEDSFHVIPKDELLAVEVTAARVHRPATRGLWVASELRLELASSGGLEIEDAADYRWMALMEALREWRPELAVTIPPELLPRRQEVAPAAAEAPREPKAVFLDVIEGRPDRLLARYPDAGVLAELPLGLRLSDDPVLHFEQLLDAAGIRVSPLPGQPDGKTCHRLERPLIVRRRLLDRLFALVLRDAASLDHVVAPQVAKAASGAFVAVLWFDCQWNDYACADLDR